VKRLPNDGAGVGAVILLSNLFADLPKDLPEESVQTLINAGSVSIERIVSHGHASPDGFWYDQDQHEWVMVMKGEVRLRFEGDELPVAMKPGDWLNIPAHKKHRVEWTTPDEPTIWLAVHYDMPK
jgi:cupin 2 domain-containing protein